MADLFALRKFTQIDITVSCFNISIDISKYIELQAKCQGLLSSELFDRMGIGEQKSWNEIR
jgi:hypothetical protein